MQGSSKPIKLTQEQLRQLQLVELEMLIEFDRICRKYDIKYSLDGGTLLGAVRHNGFIPWDDDIDVIMLRKEYQKFKKIAKKELDTERFFLQDYTTDPGYRWGWAKIRRNGTSFIRKGQEHLKQRDGIFMDIFVLDAVPDKCPEKELHFLVCNLIRKGLYSPIGAESATNPISKVTYCLMNSIPRNTYFKLRNRLAIYSHKRNKNSELVSHYTYTYPKTCRYGMPRDCVSNVQEIGFEGRKFLGMIDYDRYLTLLYGDYMKMPPVESQVSHLTVVELRFPEENK